MQEYPVSRALHSLEDFLVAKFSQAMDAWPADLVSDIYALSLYCSESMVPYRPGVELHYNTGTHLALPGKLRLPRRSTNRITTRHGIGSAGGGFRRPNAPRVNVAGEPRSGNMGLPRHSI